jgi:hypothetical protein
VAPGPIRSIPGSAAPPTSPSDAGSPGYAPLRGLRDGSRKRHRGFGTIESGRRRSRRPRYPHHESNPLPNEGAATGCRRDGIARARLQSYACHEHHGRPAAHGGDGGIVVADMPSSSAAEPPKTAGISTRSTSRRKETPNPEDDRARPPRPRSQRICASARAFLHGQGPYRTSISLSAYFAGVHFSRPLQRLGSQQDGAHAGAPQDWLGSETAKRQSA